LEVENNERTLVECGHRFHDQRHTLRCVLPPDLSVNSELICEVLRLQAHLALARGNEDKALRLSDSEHEGLNLKLGAPGYHREELNAKNSGEFTTPMVSIAPTSSGIRTRS